MPAAFVHTVADMTSLAVPASSRVALYLDLIRWSRPAGWLLLLWPTLAALWIAADGWPGWHLVAVFVLGTILMRSAGCCINDVADIDFDRHVKRTAQRPVTRGAVSVREALLLGAMLALLAFLLVLTTNPPTIALSFAGLAITLAYPYAKRVVSMPQAVLGVAFSFGIPMAYAAALGGGDWNFGAIAAAVLISTRLSARGWRCARRPSNRSRGACTTPSAFSPRPATITSVRKSAGPGRLIPWPRTRRPRSNRLFSAANRDSRK